MAAIASPAVACATLYSGARFVVCMDGIKPTCFRHYASIELCFSLLGGEWRYGELTSLPSSCTGDSVKRVKEL